MLWFTLSIFTALSIAVRDVSIKTYGQLSPLEIAAIELFWSLPLLLLGCLWVPVPALDQTFWWAFLLSIPINILAYIIYLYSIKISPLSLTVPFLAFTPAFMILTGFFVLNEKINIWGGLGIGFIVLGSYILNFNKIQYGLLKPLAALLHEKGSWMMLIVALIFSFAAVIGKKAMLHSSPLFFSYYCTLHSCIYDCRQKKQYIIQHFNELAYFKRRKYQIPYYGNSPHVCRYAFHQYSRLIISHFLFILFIILYT
jgi:drug/metabolite transporter (DMT)-like permease